MKTARELYDGMVAVIDHAVAAHNIFEVPEAAEREGMVGGEISRGTGQRWEYSYADANGHTVKVECRWYDQSQAFSIQPDMHVMTVTLDGNASHSRRYEE